MTKAELIKAWHEATPALGKAQLEVALNNLGSIIAADLLGGGEVSLPGVGKLKVTRLSARQGRNPRTGEPLAIPARKKVVLVMGKELKEALN